MERPQSTTPEWIDIYRDNSIKAHQLRQANDHIGAKQLFEEALQGIEDEKHEGNTDERLMWLGATLTYAVLDCQILLQSTPSEVMKTLHNYGDILKEMMLDISRLDGRFDKVSVLFDSDFTATDIEHLKGVIQGFENAMSASETDFSPELNKKLAMLYFYLSNFFQQTQLFFGFSTMMIKEGEQSKDLFREMANKTVAFFKSLDDEFLKERDLNKYKDYTNKWFSIYADVMEAKYALDVRDNADDSNWEYQPKDIDMLWGIIETSLQEESEDPAINQMNQNAAAQAMEVLMDVYSTEALMNIQNYERAFKGLDRISDEADKLNEPRKVIFYNHLKRAIIARKYLLDMRYKEGLVLSQLNPIPFLSSQRGGSEDTDVQQTQYEPTFPDGLIEVSHVNEFDAQTTNAIEGAAQKPPLLSLPDENDEALNSIAQEFMPTNVYEQSEQRRRELRKDEKFMDWERTFVQQLRKDFELAKMYIPDGFAHENHINKRWLSILEARSMLYEHFHSEEEENEKGRKPKDSEDRIRESILELIDESLPLAKLARIEELLLPYTEMPKGTYFRQIVEIYIILGWVYVEKIDQMKHELVHEEDIDINREPYVCFDKARDYLCTAFNMLKDLGDKSTTLHNEIRRAYAKLKFINHSAANPESKEDSVVPTIDKEAREFRLGQWNKAFCDILRSPELLDLHRAKRVLISEFESKVKEFVPQIVSIRTFKPGIKLPPGAFTKNDIADSGTYKTVVKVVSEDDLVLGIESELPIPADVLELLPRFVTHVFNLMQIYDARVALSGINVEKFRHPVRKNILETAAGIVDSLIPQRVKEDNSEMFRRYYQRLVESYNLRLYSGIDPDFSNYLVRLFDAGMAGIESYFFEKPEDELLPFEKFKKQQHTDIGVKILGGIFGMDDEFRDLLAISEFHHKGTNGVSGLDDKMLFLLDILRVSQKLKEFEDNELTEPISMEEREKKIKIFLLEQEEKGFSKEFIEFVQEELYPDEEVRLM